MTTRRTLLLLAALALVAALWITAAPVWYVGDVGVCATSALPLYRSQQIPFDSTAWKTGGPDLRGRMLSDLVSKRELEGARAEMITKLLGPHECYVNYDDEPCYNLRLNGDRRQFAMTVAHSGQQRGTILRARLTEDPSSFFGGC